MYFLTFECVCCVRKKKCSGVYVFFMCKCVNAVRNSLLSVEKQWISALHGTCKNRGFWCKEKCKKCVNDKILRLDPEQLPGDQQQDPPPGLRSSCQVISSGILRLASGAAAR